MISKTSHRYCKFFAVVRNHWLYSATWLLFPYFQIYFQIYPCSRFNVLFYISRRDRPKEGGKQKISLQVVSNLASKGYTKSKDIKCKMEIWKRNSSPGSQLFSYREPRKNLLKVKLLLLWAIFPCFFHSCLPFSCYFLTSDLTFSTNVKNEVLTFRTELVKRVISLVSDSLSWVYRLSVSIIHVSKTAIIYSIIDVKLKRRYEKCFFRLS